MMAEMLNTYDHDIRFQYSAVLTEMECFTSYSDGLTVAYGTSHTEIPWCVILQSRRHAGETCTLIYK